MTEMEPQVQDAAQNAIVAERRAKLERIRAAGVAYPNDFERKDLFGDLTAQYGGKTAEELEAERPEVAVAGRMMLKRLMGRASFATVRDFTGEMQYFIEREAVGEESYAAFKQFDLGDVVAARGTLFRTKAGDLAVAVRDIRLMAKCIRPLPDKHKGLVDTEMCYRQRYVDLIMNEESRSRFLVRSKAIAAIRGFMIANRFLEVETPMLHPIPGGANAKPFVTHHNALDMDMYLRIAPELYLKRLVVGGFERVFEINRNFRNEGVSARHNPEFTMMEFYATYWTYRDQMDFTEALLRHVAQEATGSAVLHYQGETIDLTPGWRRLTMVEAVKEYVGVDFDAITDDAEAVAAAKSIGVELPETADKTWGNALYECFDQKVEEKLIQPTFITMYPVEVSPLTKRSPADPRLTERFELFICHSELANAYSELNDPIDQRQRFEKQVEQRERGDDETEMLDEDFLTAMEYGMPPTGGMGMGIDRCVMLLTGADTIREVILFPTMKTLEPKRAENKAEKAAVNGSAEAATVSAPSVQIDLSKVKIEPLFADDVDFETFSKSDFRVVKIEACEAVPKSKKLLKFTLNDGTDRKRLPDLCLRTVVGSYLRRIQLVDERTRYPVS